MKLSLANSILRVVVFGIGLTAVLILITIWNVSSRQINKQLDKDLLVAQGVFSKVSEERRQQLVNNASILTADFGFKRAIATKDPSTINSVLFNHGERIDADLMFITDLEGKVTSDYPSGAASFERYPNENLIDLLLAFGSLDEFRVIDDQLYQIILLPVKAPNFIAVAGIAFRYDHALLNELKSIIQGDIVIRLTGKDGVEKILVSTFDDISRHPMFLSSGEAVWRQGILQNRSVYLTSDIELANMADKKLHVSLAQNITPIYREMLSTQLSVVGIASLVMLLTLSISVLFSKRVSKPVSMLVSLANRIADGDYQKHSLFRSRLLEIDFLASALFRMRDNIQQREQEIQYRAEHDMLTKLKNRAYFENELQNCLRDGHNVQVIGFSIIGFQEMNDLYGFTNADKCLQVLAQRLLKVAGVKSRLSSGDMTLLPAHKLNQSELLEIQEQLQQPALVDALKIQIRIAVGVIETNRRDDNAESILRKLNIILEQAKHDPNPLLFYEPEREKTYLRRLAVITELKRTLASRTDELFLVYQPKINLKTGQVHGAEALIRWVNASLGFVPPDEFIGLAEQAGLIEHVTKWVMTRAVSDLKHFRERGLTLSIALNLSTQDVENKSLLEYFEQLLSKNNIGPNEIDLEVTESDIVADASTAIKHLSKLRNEGFQIAIDDFGTGYSSLAYLKDLPVSLIKIDRCFVMQLSNNQTDQTLVKITLELAKAFNLKVVAEGVEDSQSMQLLSEWGCDYAQGYYIAKPLKVNELITFVREYAYQKEAQ